MRTPANACADRKTVFKNEWQSGLAFKAIEAAAEIDPACKDELARMRKAMLEAMTASSDPLVEKFRAQVSP